MKTIDKVIDGIEHCYTSRACSGCPYDYDPRCTLNQDMIYYLKEYQSLRLKNDKPVPVQCRCGGEPQLIMIKPGVYIVVCDNCYTSTDKAGVTEAEAVKLWNMAMKKHKSPYTGD